MYAKYIVVLVIGIIVGGVGMYILWVNSLKSIKKKKAEEKMENDKFLKSIGINKSKEV